MTAQRRESERSADVTIIGGGAAGLTLAALLARASLRIAVVEADTGAASLHNHDYDLRTLAITRASASILEACGAWAFMKRNRHGCFRRMEVWDEHSRGRIRFDSGRLAEATLGHIFESRVLRAALEDVLRARENVVWHRPMSLSSFIAGDDRLVLTLSDGQRLDTRLLVGAEGADSRVRLLAGIGYERHDYRQQAIVCNVRTERAHDETARQRFLGTGPLAFLPLADPYLSSIVWSTTPEEAQHLLGLEAPAFREELGRAFDFALGEVIETGARAAFPLMKARAIEYVQPRIALIGDAAHSIHPLAGQGANLSLLDAAALAEVVNESTAQQADIGSQRTLRRYERWRKGENAFMQSVMDGFHALFGSRQSVLQALRGAGLNAVDRCDPLKDLIMRRAMGLEGDLPLVARNFRQAAV